MKIRLFIAEIALVIGHKYSLDKSQSHYLKNVLRVKEAKNIFVFNNKDGEFLAEVTAYNKDKIVEIIIIKQTKMFYLPPKIGLVFSPVKNVKTEYIVTKATELGAIVIQPIQLERTIVKKVNSEKLQLNAIEAAEQSRRVDLPVIEKMKTLKEFLAELYSNDIIILADETGKGKIPEELFQHLTVKRDSRVFVIIGPEGGISDKDRELIYQSEKNHSMILGPRILRADTAIIASLMLLQNYIGDIRHC